jgi:site-specific recombinase XerD
MAKSGWVLDESKFLSTGEAKRLLKTAKTRAVREGGASDGTAAKEHLIVHLALSTGLRVSELADLRCGDIFLANGKCSLLVRSGKGSKRRAVRFDGPLREHLTRCLGRKKRNGEGVGEDAPLLVSASTGRAMTVRGIQKAFKRCAARAGLSRHYSIHSLRHTYACHLYKASGWNLRVVQKQLGHARIATTQVYADVMEPDLKRALKRLYR